MCYGYGFSNIKAVIFDCDGTLVDSEYAHYLAFNLTLQEKGCYLSQEDYRQYVGKGDRVVSKLLAERIGIDCADEIFQKKRTHYLKLCYSGLPAIEPTINFLKNLAKEKKRLGIKIGVCSAAKKEEIMSHLWHLGIEELLDIILSGEEDLVDYSDPEGVNKPKPYIYLHAMKKLGVSPKQCIVIEDSNSGIRAGVSAGCFTIAIPNEYTRDHDLSQAHLRLETFDNVSIDQFFQMVEFVK